MHSFMHIDRCRYCDKVSADTEQARSDVAIWIAAWHVVSFFAGTFAAQVLLIRHVGPAELIRRAAEGAGRENADEVWPRGAAGGLFPQRCPATTNVLRWETLDRLASLFPNMEIAFRAAGSLSAR